MTVLYVVLTTLIAVCVWPVAMVLVMFGKPALLARLRPPELPDRGGRPRLWIHAASVGEVGIALALAGEAAKSDPARSIVISTVTVTGLDRVRRAMDDPTGPPIDGAFLAPLDCPAVTGAFVRHIAPTACALVETELWPSLVGTLAARGVPVSLVNARLSKRAFRRYMMVEALMRPVLERISLICAQSRTFSRRFMLLGAPPEHVEVMGNIKFDSLPEPGSFDAAALRQSFGIPGDAPLIVAGSTRPGEEEVLARAFTDIAKTMPDAALVLVPRHLKRLPEIGEVLDGLGLPHVTRTSEETMTGTGRRILVMDTMGELITAFACADVTFIGGSLRDFGGHNPLEAAALGKPVLFGPYMEQIGSKELLANGAAALIHDAADTAAVIGGLLGDSAERQAMGEAGIAVVAGLRGTLARTLRCMHDRRVI